MIGGPALFGNVERAHPEALGEPAGHGRPSGLDAEIAHGAPARSVWAVGIVWSGWSEKVSQPGVGCGRERVEPGCAADVADEGARARATSGGLARFADRVVRDAEEDDRGAGRVELAGARL